MNIDKKYTIQTYLFAPNELFDSRLCYHCDSKAVDAFYVSGLPTRDYEGTGMPALCCCLECKDSFLNTEDSLDFLEWSDNVKKTPKNSLPNWY